MGMLVVTRERGQRVMIGHRDAGGKFMTDVTITLVSIGQGRVKARLGIEAGPEVLILREELLANEEEGGAA